MTAAFKRRSTLLGFAASAIVVTVVGSFTHWRSTWVAIYIIVALASLWFFSRVFYGLHAAKSADKAKADPGSAWAAGGWPGGLRWDGRTPENWTSAYEKLQMGDASELKRIGNEEDT